MIYRPKITHGCPKTGQGTGCNTTQETPFNKNIPSAEEMAAKGMAIHRAYRDSAGKVLDRAEEKERRKAEEDRTRKHLRRNLSQDQIITGIRCARSRG